MRHPDTNLKGCFLCTQAAARSMPRGGVVVNIGSGCNKVPFPGLVAYTASKGGIEMLTKVAAVEARAAAVERPVVEHLRPPEGVLEVRLRVRAAEEMPARPDLAHRVHRLAVLREVDPLGQRVQHPELVGVEHELLVGRHQPALEPAAGVQHEVHARRAAPPAACWRSRRPPARPAASSRRGPRPSGTAGSAAAPAARPPRGSSTPPASRRSAPPSSCRSR